MATNMMWSISFSRCVNGCFIDKWQIFFFLYYYLIYKSSHLVHFSWLIIACHIYCDTWSFNNNCTQYCSLFFIVSRAFLIKIVIIADDEGIFILFLISFLYFSFFFHSLLLLFLWKERIRILLQSEICAIFMMIYFSFVNIFQITNILSSAILLGTLKSSII